MTRQALTATGRIGVEPGGGRQRIRWSQSWPVVIRPTGDEQVHLVHGAGGPLGGDDFGLDVDVAPGAVLRVCSAGATIVQPGAGSTALWNVRAEVGSGARLDWGPEPTVVCDGAALQARLQVRLAAGAGAVLREVVVLGRYGERGGRYRGELAVDVGGEVLLAHSTLLDGADPVLCGPAGTGGARTVGTLVLAGAAARRAGAGIEDAGNTEDTGGGEDTADGAGEGPGVRWAWTELAGPGRMLLAVGDPGAVTALLDAQARIAGRCRTEPPQVVIPAPPSRTRGRGAATAPAAGR